MAFPKTLYVRYESDDDNPIYLADTNVKDAREEGGSKIQRLGVYHLDRVIETEENIEIREVGKV